MEQHANKKMFFNLDFISVILIIGMTGYTFYAITQMPETIPIHWTKGEVDGWGSKWISLILPSITVVLYGFFIVLAKYLNKRNHSITFINWLKLGCVVWLSFGNFYFLQDVLG